MWKIVAGALMFTGCATAGIPVDREPGGGGHIRFEGGASADVVRVEPQALDAQLPSADRIANRIRALGGDLSADVRLCVTPDGRVASVELARRSALPQFDQAVMNDAASWQFSSLPGPRTVRTCERATVTYRPHS